jgi:hypothetical protein
MPEDRAIEVDTVSDYLSSLNLIAGPSALIGLTVGLPVIAEPDCWAISLSFENTRHKQNA